MPTFLPYGNRLDGIGGTDARQIMTGDWDQLWEQKTGLTQPPNLEGIFRVQLGKFTEPFHARWFARQTGYKLDDPGDQPTVIKEVAPSHDPWMFATFDRWIIDMDVPLEMKHTYSGNSLEDAATYYMGQLQHQIVCAGTNSCIFSIIQGNSEPIHGVVARDEPFIAKMLELERLFWGYVTRKERPPAIGIDVAEVKGLADSVPINGRKAYDYTTNNEWVAKAGEYLLLKPKADEFKVIDKELRELIPADASQVTGGGLLLKRDARGAFRTTILDDKEPKHDETK